MSDSSGVKVQYEDLVENHPFIIICYRPDTTIFYANRAAHEYFAAPAGSLLGHRWIHDLPEERQPENRADLLRYTPDAPVRTIENPVRRGDGADRWIRWTSRAFFNEAAEITHFQTLGIDVTDRKQGELLRENLLGSLAEGVFGIDADGNYTFLNPAACELLGFASEDEALSHNSHELSHHSRPDGQAFPATECPVYRVLRTGEPLQACEEYFWSRAGHGFPVLINAAPLFDARNRVTGAVVSFQDITERRAAREALEQREAELQEAQQIAHLGNWISDFDAGGIRWSSEVFRIFGLEYDQWGATHEAFMQAVHPDDRERVQRAVDDALTPEGSEYDIEHRIVRPDGSVRIVYQRGSVDFDTQGRPQRMAGVVHDITERREAERHLHFITYHDALTGLPNRTRFAERADQAVTDAERLGRPLVLAHIGLDRFKSVNEGMGQATGDEVLQHVARRLENRLPVGGVLARLGGDEFGALLPVESPGSVAGAVTRLLEPLRQIIKAGEHELYVPGSVGVAVYPHDTQDAPDLMRRAESAMHQAKRTEGNAIQFCSGELNNDVRTRVSLEGQLRRAVDHQEGFFLHYQPRMAAGDGRIVGVEALLRWEDGAGTVHSPGAFIPILEETGLIVELGQWILTEACRQCREWHQAGLPPVRVSVNLAAPQFRDRQIAHSIDRVLEHTHLSADALELEVTESMLMADTDQVIRTLGQFRERGVRVALDDFGTGYSSLAYLRRFPLDVLKIDRCFVADLETESSAGAIVRTILSLADNLGLESVAEGVETEAQQAFLQEAGCQTLQGFLFARPQPAADCQQMLAEPASSAATQPGRSA
ncbi:EAL domain-containing protein [Thioalkalivibrio sp. ALM2T]|uniref:sensor domain-containing protein n=1 Tax=Thioalkalivibrio sp. ALM2T TaxID=1158184 RepID=UPI0003600560|nr:EAL domain-containing protein [Thioalkalivibrio sp. ALM2T]